MKQEYKQKQWLLEKYVSYFFIYSFIGWVLEVIITLFQMKEFENRGFLNLPILPIYGFGAIIISLIYKDDDHHWFAIALVGGTIATLLELSTSFLLEKTMSISLWDYSAMKWNFQGRISLASSIFFMIGAVLIIKILNPVIEKKLRRYKYNIYFEIILSILCLATFFDFVYSSYIYLIK